MSTMLYLLLKKRCDLGWTGKDCKDRKYTSDKCGDNCSNNGVCVPDGDSYTCKCDFGYSPTDNCKSPQQIQIHGNNGTMGCDEYCKRKINAGAVIASHSKVKSLFDKYKGSRGVPLKPFGNHGGAKGDGVYAQNEYCYGKTHSNFDDWETCWCKPTNQDGSDWI
jgi:hypothetical protein